MFDRNDPAYKKARRKTSQWLGLLQSVAMITADEDDDEVAFIISEVVNERFDELWALRHGKKK